MFKRSCLKAYAPLLRLPRRTHPHEHFACALQAPHGLRAHSARATVALLPLRGRMVQRPRAVRPVRQLTGGSQIATAIGERGEMSWPIEYSRKYRIPWKASVFLLRRNCTHRAARTRGIPTYESSPESGRFEKVQTAAGASEG
ncbi:hypothetical protein OH77DRAFT_1430104 [Trametes cingulata]|nr:hypothetical protein OH77DRAFT_1430104 [Trametes cingulata]